MQILSKILIVIAVLIIVLLLIILILILIPFRYNIEIVYDNRKLNVDAKYIIFKVAGYINFKFPVEYEVKLWNKTLVDSNKNKEEKEEDSISDTDFIKDKNLEKDIDTSDKVIKDLFISAKKQEEIVSNEENNLSTDDRKIDIEEKDKKVADSKENKKSVRITKREREKVKTNNELINRLFKLIERFMGEEKSYVIELITNKVILLINKIKPKNMKTEISYGFDDAYNTGILSAIFAPIASITKGKFNLFPNFKQNGFKAETKITGSIIILSIVKAAIEILLDKKFRIIVFSKNK